MFQFTHVEGYALSSSKKAPVNKAGKPIKSPKRNVREIVGEVVRDEEHCPHVENPQPPNYLFGDEAAVRSIPDRIEKNVAEWKRLSGKTLRKDAQVLFTQVASYPNDGEDYLGWKARTLDYLKKRYGDKLVAVVEHTDEAHPHIHAYVIQPFGQCPDVKPLHPGHAAAKDADSPKDQRTKYTKAMREFQDDFYQEVGQHCGMTRIGPGRRRLSREQWKAEQLQAVAIKEGFQKIAQLQADLDARATTIDTEVEKRTSIKLKAEAVKKMQKAVPDLPNAPAAWEPWRFADYIDTMHKLIKAQAEQLAFLPEMRETLAVYRAEGARLKEQVTELTKKVDGLMKTARAWSTVEQAFPEVAQEVVRRLDKKHTPIEENMGGQPSVATVTYDHVISNP